MAQAVIRVADFREHQVCVKAIVGEAAGSLGGGAGRSTSTARNATGRGLIRLILAPSNDKRLISFSIMIERDFVLALDHVEIAKRILRGSNATGVVRLSELVESSFEVSKGLIGMTLLEQRAATAQRGVRIGLRIERGSRNVCGS